MHYRTLGRTGLKVSEIGFGSWGISGRQWIGAEDANSLRALHAARDAGVTFFDTALAYGDGHSEQLLARAFGRSREVVIASKAPPKNLIWPAAPDSRLEEVFPREHVLESLETSYRNLGREIDLYQFHVWNDSWADLPEWQGTAEAIRRSGRARFIGISINDHQPNNALRALETGLVDAVQVIYNIFDQSPEDELFPYCQQHHIGVIARVPFDEGALTGRVRPETKFPPEDFRNQYFSGQRKEQVWDRVNQITRSLGIGMEQMPEAALRFCLSSPAVSTVIPGMRTPAHAQANAAASSRGALAPAQLAELRPYRWEKNFYAEI
ncbi:MAG: aldo/keto reductase [Terriglobales bacterium]